MPTLHWIGKEKVINHHLDVPFKVLEHSYGFDNGTQTSTETQSGNKIIHGDNLEALKALLPEYEGRIDCIYIDPPYNTGEESWIYNDNVSHPKLAKWIGQVVGKESEDLGRHDKWLCMIYPRLQLLSKLLKDAGVIFISIDDNELFSLK
ncbi:MAG TPA: type III restriction endonuclease subunit M, partial [Algoriphagus sp.]|nr:type III restriction endonuclease subunit M [Algoriphagus sp.]